jgi:hypothetical protein
MENAMTHTSETVLKSWKTLNEVIDTLREDQIKELIFWEVEHKKREDIVVRLHQRFNKLAAAREREELLAQIK